MDNMQIYLIRHAHAEDGMEDALRPLSAKGRRQTGKMAAHLKKAGLLQTEEFWHSPLVRARRTAELLAGRLVGKARLVEVAGLEPEADPAIMALRLNGLRRPVALVGHEPHLSTLATLLVAGRVTAPVVVMKKCAVLALKRTGRVWAMRWLVSPGEI
jgi:phosphohistidine phosphatase